jgi:hypothetical protein
MAGARGRVSMADEDEQDTEGTEEGEDEGFKDLGVVSSCFASIRYNATSKSLQMTFAKGGSYIIEGIEAIEVDRWVNSGSPGGYFNSFVRGAY